MESTTRTEARAWKLFTPGGLAAFAASSFVRLLQAQLLFAIVVAGCAVWAFHRTWGLAWEEAIPKLPAASRIRNGVLEWKAEPLVRLGENRFLAIVADVNSTGEFSSPSDFQIELGIRQLRIRSLLGSLPLDYPAPLNVPLDRLETAAWWGAWQPAVLTALGAAVLMIQVLTWDAMAILYMIPARLLALALGRSLTMRGAWSIAAAAQLAGALIGCAAVIGYSMGRVDIVRLTWIALLQLPISWLLLALALFRLPSPAAPPGASSSQNPFAS